MHDTDFMYQPRCTEQLWLGSRVVRDQGLTYQAISIQVSCTLHLGHAGLHFAEGNDYIREKLVNGETKPVNIRQHFTITWSIEDMTDTEQFQEMKAKSPEMTT